MHNRDKLNNKKNNNDTQYHFTMKPSRIWCFQSDQNLVGRYANNFVPFQSTKNLHFVIGIGIMKTLGKRHYHDCYIECKEETITRAICKRIWNMRMRQFPIDSVLEFKPLKGPLPDYIDYMLTAHASNPSNVESVIRATVEHIWESTNNNSARKLFKQHIRTKYGLNYYSKYKRFFEIAHTLDCIMFKNKAYWMQKNF